MKEPTLADMGTGVRPALRFVLASVGREQEINPLDVPELFGYVDGAIVQAKVHANVLSARWLKVRRQDHGEDTRYLVSATREAWIAHTIAIVGEEEVTRWLLEWEEG